VKLGVRAESTQTNTSSGRGRYVSDSTGRRRPRDKTPRLAVVSDLWLLEDVATMAKGHGYDKEHVVVHGVDDSVFPDSDSVTRADRRAARTRTDEDAPRVAQSRLVTAAESLGPVS
jgi:hypothetical protein